jgi:uncharacterized protein (TIGR03382 family)
MMRRLTIWMTGVVLLCSPLSWAITIPDGFNLIGEAAGLQAYRKDYAGGQPDFVIVVSLNAARVQNMTGDRRGEGTGPFGGPNPTFARLSLRSFWDRARSSYGDAFAVANAQFFSTASASQAPLAFAVWESGNISDGYGTASEFPGQMRLLQIDHANNRATITGFDAGVYTAADGPDFRLAGLSEDANKGPTNYVGRTFAGVHDASGDGVNDTVLLFCSSYAQQAGSAAVLRSFGASEVIMLDGGGSSQMIVNGSDLVGSSRAIPHALLLRPDAAPVPVTCEDECVAPSQCTASGEVQYCGLHDEDPCREWSAPRACDAGQTCLGTGCAADPVQDSDAGSRDAGGTTTDAVIVDASDSDPGENPGCTSDCSLAGTRECVDESTYHVCVDEEPGCSRWAAAVACAPGRTCSGGICSLPDTRCPDDNRCDIIECGVEPVCGVDCGECAGELVCISNVCSSGGASPDAGALDSNSGDSEPDDTGQPGADSTESVDRAGCATTGTPPGASPLLMLALLIVRRRRRGHRQHDR